ncbi:ATP-dependent DNA helicase RecG [Porticoccus sp. W117]|uniref:ATP-dependent DNA helicase RecG n=1 Tax=Porticoccus sp. W117 TaxID=3054777 RepID=UPI002592CD12|nr:ATP-dependent DNA helicase RecG [Porticoccus sp. W117]MDM3870523.1 ATP-dependent DNA helicase RecG [Porticoccus sp. W117]
MAIKLSKSLDKTPVTALHGVGQAFAEKLHKLGIRSVQDVLFHLPIRYTDRTRITPIGALQPFSDIVIEGEIRATDIVFGKRRSLMCKVQDNTGTITLRFFHFSAAQRNNLATGQRIRCYGEVRRGSSGLEIYHPEYQLLKEAQPPALENSLTAIYPATEGLTQQRMRSLANQGLALITSHNLQELLPEQLAPQSGFSLADALRYLHQPPANAPLDKLAAGEHPTQQRLAFEELLTHHLSLLQLRQRVQSFGTTPLAIPRQLHQQFLQSLGFTLTNAQQQVFEEIRSDLTKPQPMLRLVQGDVGSGKTVVAALAALAAVGSGKQAAIMAPTEILAEQHRNSFENWLKPLGIRIAWLTGKLKGKGREAQLAAIADGSAALVVGTHALFQDDVQFHDLGLIVIDEQHRFGVHQRLALREKGQREKGSGEKGGGQHPHQLVMTATPIPRTLAMSAYADLDCSVIDELPPGRTPVETVAIANNRRQQIIDRVRKGCSEKRQAYWVCTLVEESDVLEAQAAKATADELQLLLPELSIGLIHGRLKAKEKEQVMAAFKTGEIDLLVATTVIEVGVDVPNASLMVIENPERLGLAQLHQLRGRVGRGSAASYCVLLYSPPLSNNGVERLKIMRETNDGFRIAEKDLQLRGPGEVLGTRQTGEISLRIADLQRDAHLITDVRRSAQQLLAQHPELAEQLIARWLPGAERYGSV